MTPLITAYIGLGSNLHQPIRQVQAAIVELKQQRHLQDVQASPIYASKPVGPQDQPDFINAVARVKTRLGPHDLLDLLQDLEQHHGRIRKRHWGERTLDLDLLTYGHAEIRTPRLTVPHPLLFTRSFVLYPFADLDAHFLFNNGLTLNHYLQKVAFDLTPVKKGN
ncbi:MAG: 2-amino-4-hydroxy-6-hydroxymethyldihydropteridine diphosphokinase [Bermanella sp.]